MTSGAWLSADEQRVWRNFLRMEAQLLACLSRDLQRTADLSLADYGVLVNLSDGPGERLRVFELGEILKWEQSRLSHHLARMQRRGLVAREECPSDRRGAVIALTDTGRARLVDAAPAHVDTVRRLLFDHLDAESLAALDRITSDFLGRLDEHRVPAGGALDSPQNVY